MLPIIASIVSNSAFSVGLKLESIFLFSSRTAVSAARAAKFCVSSAAHLASKTLIKSLGVPPVPLWIAVT